MDYAFLALLLLVSTALLGAQLWSGVAPGAAVLAPRECSVPGEDNCTLPLMLGDGTCAPTPAARGTRCQSACHAYKATSTYCDGVTATCSAHDPDECLGTCTSHADDSGGGGYCATVLPLDTSRFWAAFCAPDKYAPQEGVLNWDWTCDLSACSAWLLGVFAVTPTSGDDVPAVVGVPTTDCADYMNQTWLRQPGMRACLVVERTLLSAALVNATTQLPSALATSYAVQPFLCTYRYACAPTANVTMIQQYVDDAVPLSKRGNSGLRTLKRLTESCK